MDGVAQEAWRREASHGPGHRNFRPHLRERGANLIGLRGEQVFAEAFGLQLDLSPRLGGDGGQDLELLIRGSLYAVDCKSAILPKDLIVEVARCRPRTIYVLCRYYPEDDRAGLLGWQWGLVLMRSEPRDYGYGVINHWCPRDDLRPMEELRRLWLTNALAAVLATKKAPFKPCDRVCAIVAPRCVRTGAILAQP